MPLRIIEPVSAQMPDASKHLLFAIREMFLKPMLEQCRHSPRKTNNRIAGKLRARFCACVQDLGNFMISKAGNDWRNHYTRWNSCAAKLSDRIEPRLRR